jgi:integrase
LWIIPAQRMKAKEEHRIPLIDAAINILKTQPRIVGNDHLFFGQSKQRNGLSNMAMLLLLKDEKASGGLGYPQATVHGFRSAFRDWAGETTQHRRKECLMKSAGKSSMLRATQRNAVTYSPP